MTARRFSPFPKRISDVGVLFDLTIHDVDIICSLTNSKPLEVYAVGGNAKNNKYEDYATVVIRFENGSIGIFLDTRFFTTWGKKWLTVYLPQ